MKIYLLYFALLTPFFIVAQNNEGIIFFEETIQFEIDLPETDAHMADMFPSEQTSQQVLFFNPSASLYKGLDPEDEGDIETTVSEGDATIKMVIMRQDNRIFKNLANGEKIDQQDYFGKKFLIKDGLDEFEWKLTGQQKMILDYSCQEAVAMTESDTIHVWFTPQIPVSTGPGALGQLPGVILEAVYNDGERTVKARKVEFKTIDKKMMEAPKKGKVVSQEEFQKIVEEREKEMEEMGGGMRIEIRN